jgi:hypothetical protein
MPRVVTWMNDNSTLETSRGNAVSPRVPIPRCSRFSPAIIRALRPPFHYRLRAGRVWEGGQKAHFRIITVASLPRKRGFGSCSRAQPLSY